MSNFQLPNNMSVPPPNRYPQQGQAGPSNISFNQQLEAYQRLQSQESQKIDQQRLSTSSQHNNQAALQSMAQLAGNGNAVQQAQFLAQMRNMGVNLDSHQMGNLMGNLGNLGGGGNNMQQGGSGGLNLAQLGNLVGAGGNPLGGAGNGNPLMNMGNLGGGQQQPGGGQMELSNMGRNAFMAGMMSGQQPQQQQQQLQSMLGGNGNPALQQQGMRMNLGNVGNMANNGQNINMAAFEMAQQSQGQGGGESEQGRRQMLQSMLASQLAQISSQPPGQNPQQMQPQQIPPQQQQQQQQLQPQQQPPPPHPQYPTQTNQQQSRPPQPNQATNQSISPESLGIMMKLPAHVREQLWAKHGNNPAAAMAELSTSQQWTKFLQNMNQQQQQQQQQNPQMAQQQNRQPQPISVNGQILMPPQQQQQQPQQPNFNQQNTNQQRPNLGNLTPQMMQQALGQQSGHQRIPSDTTNLSNMVGSGTTFDAKQFEALQQMKQRQERQAGLTTPQLMQGGLPMMSPNQAMQQSQSSQQPQGPQQPNFVPPQQLTPQGQRLPQPTAPPPIQQNMGRNPSGSGYQNQTPMQQAQQLPQQQQQQQPQQQAQQQAQQPSTVYSNGSNHVEVMSSWSDDQLLRNTQNLIQKISQPGYSKTDPIRYHFLQLIAEFKKRNLPLPAEASPTTSILFGAPGVLESLLKADWQAVSQFAQAQLQQASNAAAGLTRPQQQQPQQQQRASQSAPGQGSSNNPIDMVTPQGQTQTTPRIPSYTPTQQAGILQPPQQQPQQQQQQQQQSMQPVNDQQAAQFAALRQQQAAVQRPPSFSAGQSGQMFPQQQQPQQQSMPIQQQPQQQAQNSTQQPLPSGKSRPWLDMDFRSEEIRISEEHLWDTAKKVSMNPDLQVPTIDGKPVSIHQLFILVHKNGGFARVDANPQSWSMLAGYLGFGESTSEKPPLGSYQVAQQLRDIYMQYLCGLEDLHYSRLWKQRKLQAEAQQKAQAHAQQLQQQQQQQQQMQQFPNQQQQQQQNQQNQMPQPPNFGFQQNQPPQQQSLGNNNDMAQPIPQIPANMSAQFLDAMSKNGALNEQQKRFIEDFKRQGGGQQAVNVPNMTRQSPAIPAGNIKTPNSGQLQSQQPLPPSQQQQQQQSSSNSASSATNIAFLAGIKQNPSLIYRWIKTREDQMKQKFQNRVAVVPPEDQPRLLAESRVLADTARQVQDRMPKYMLVAAEKGPEEFNIMSSLISMYKVILHVNQQAEQQRYSFRLDEIEKFKQQLQMALNRANRTYEEVRAAKGAEGLEALFLGLTSNNNGQQPPIQAQGQLQPHQQSNMDHPVMNAALAANLPKGLRVEDLKPPPKRGQSRDNKPSPNVSGVTPEAKTPKTPASSGLLNESPTTITATGASPAKAKPKRKRPTVPADSAPNKRELTSMVKSENVSQTPIGSKSMPPPDLPVNALGLDVSHAATAQFFKARQELEAGSIADVWAALASASAELTEVVPGLPSAVEDGNKNVNGNNSGLSDEELFAQFMDFSTAPAINGDTTKVGNGTTGDQNAAGTNNYNGYNNWVRSSLDLETPELYHPGIGEDDSDLSPESIRTVGATTHLYGSASSVSSHLPTGGSGIKIDHTLSSQVVLGGEHLNDGNGNNTGIDGIKNGGDRVLIAMSPASMAYNGGIYAWEEYDFGTTAA